MESLRQERADRLVVVVCTEHLDDEGWFNYRVRGTVSSPRTTADNPKAARRSAANP